MKLHRITPFGAREMQRAVRESGTLPPPESMTEHWWEEHAAAVPVGSLFDLVRTWDKVGPEFDGRHAEQLHRAFPLPRRVASDRMIWPWLAAVCMRDYTLARWSGPKGLNVDRVEPTIDKNSAGRLWWSAEVVRIDRPREVCEAVGMPVSDDPYVFVKTLFSNADLHQSLTYRREFTDRTKLVAMLAFVHHHPMSTAAQRDFIRDAGLLFSTVLLDAYETDLPAPGYAVDPTACGEALELLERTLSVDRARRGPDDFALRPQRVQRGFLGRWFGRDKPGGGGS